MDFKVKCITCEYMVKNDLGVAACIMPGCMDSLQTKINELLSQIQLMHNNGLGESWVERFGLDKANKEIKALKEKMRLHAGDICSISNECDMFIDKNQDLEKENTKLNEIIRNLQALCYREANVLRKAVGRTPNNKSVIRVIADTLVDAGDNITKQLTN